MTRRILIYFTASPRAQGWRERIAVAAAHAGWRVIADVTDEAWALANSEMPTVAIGPFAQPVAGFIDEDTVVVVVRDTPGAAIAAACIADDRQARLTGSYAISVHLAEASDLARGGAVVVDGTLDSISLPHLGQIAGEPSQPYPVNAISTLAIYESLPPRVDTAIEWTLDSFVFPKYDSTLAHVDTGPSPADLTGRARTLVYGPYTVLTPGVWGLKAKVLLHPDGGVTHLRFDWGSEPDFHQANVSASEDGIYVVSLQRSWIQSAAAEFRVSTAQPHFHGGFELLSVGVKRLGEVPTLPAATVVDAL